MKQAYRNFIDIALNSWKSWIIAIPVVILLCISIMLLYRNLHHNNAVLTYGDLHLLLFLFVMIAYSIQASCLSISTSRISFSIPGLHRSIANFTFFCLTIFSAMFSIFCLVVLDICVGIPLFDGAKILAITVPPLFFLIMFAHRLFLKYSISAIFVIIILSPEFITKSFMKRPVPDINAGVAIAILAFSVLCSWYMLEKLSSRNTYISAIIAKEKDPKFSLFPSSFINIGPSRVEKSLVALIRNLKTKGLSRKILLHCHLVFFAFKGNSILKKPILFISLLILALLLFLGIFAYFASSMNEHDLPMLDIAPAILSIGFGGALFWISLNAVRLSFLGRHEKYPTIIVGSLLSTLGGMVLMGAIIGISILAAKYCPAIDFNDHLYKVHPFSCKFIYAPLLLPIILIHGLLKKDEQAMMIAYLIVFLCLAIFFVVNYSLGLVIAYILLGWFVFIMFLRERISGDINLENMNY